MSDTLKEHMRTIIAIGILFAIIMACYIFPIIIQVALLSVVGLLFYGIVHSTVNPTKHEDEGYR